MAVADTNYSSLWALTDNYDSASRLSTEQDALRQDGANQKALYNNLSGIVTNFNGVLTKLDSDTGVADTDYSDNALSAIGSAGYKIYPNGMHQKDVVTLLTAIETKFDATVTKLNSDTGVGDTDYATFSDLDTTVLQANGIKSQGDVVDYLNSVVSAHNTLLTKLDAD